MKKILLCQKATIDPGCYDSFNIWTYTHIIRAWCLIDFSEMNDNGNVLFAILLLPGKLLYLAIYRNPLCCRSYSLKKKGISMLLVKIYP